MKTLIESAERYLVEDEIEEASGVQSVDSLVKTIAELTDENDHNGTVMKLAEFLKDIKHIKIMKAIKELHSLYGHMPSQLIELRGFELKELIKQVKDTYGDEIANKIHSSF